jgi:hypothetical protein
MSNREFGADCERFKFASIHARIMAVAKSSLNPLGEAGK